MCLEIKELLQRYKCAFYLYACVKDAVGVYVFASDHAHFLCIVN